MTRGKIFEYIVVGSGPGGSITASELISAGKEVLLIEEGKPKTDAEVESFSRTEMLLKYRNGGITSTLGQTKTAYVEARCAGGGSEINSGLYHRTPPEIIQAWQKKFGIENFTEESLTPLFEEIEKKLCIGLYPTGTLPPASLKLHKGAESLGWRSMEVPRWFRPVGSSSPPSFERMGMRASYLKDFQQKNGKFEKGVRILRFKKEKGVFRVFGVRGKTPVHFKAKHLILCAGAIQSASILMRSGVRKNIGKNLGIHPMIKAVAIFDEAVNPPETGVPVHQVKEFSPELGFGCAVSTEPYLKMTLLHHSKKAEEFPVQNMAVYYAMINGGTGQVKNLPFFRDPLVFYRLEKKDLRALADGLKKLSRMLFRGGAKLFIPSHAGLPVLKNEKDIRKIPNLITPSQANLTSVHLMGTCPIGENQDLTGADSHGRIHEISGLYINDASCFCGSPGVNPQGTVMAIAMRNVRAWLNEK